MKSRRWLPRRRLLAALIPGAITYACDRARPLASFGPAAAAPQSAKDALPALCAASRCDRRIGSACLRALTARESSPDRLMRLILADLPKRGPDHWSPDALRLAVRTQSRADFRDGRIVAVDGWMLSLSEARLYALAELVAQSA